MRRFVPILLLIPLVVAAFWSVRLAYSETLDADHAAVLIPNNTAYLAQSALAAEADGRDATPLLEQIVRINPTSSQARIHLGLAAEQRGESVAAEKWLLDAFQVDRQFETRWSLANFYFRREHRPEFWKWMRSALELSYGDRTAAFDLCCHASANAAEILSVVPENARDAYLGYVVDRRRVEAIPAAAQGARDPRVLLAATDVLLETKQFSDAVDTWKKSGRAAPDGVTDSHFAGESTQRGFDWRFTSVEGVTHQQLEAGRGHRIRLSGRQPESAMLLSQYAGGLRPGTRYQLTMRLDGEAAGFEWRIAGQAIRETFTASAEVTLLELWYVRPAGAVRAEGVFDVREVTVLPLH